MRRLRTSERDMPHMIRGAKRVSMWEECQHTQERQLLALHTLTVQQARTVSKVQKSRSWSVLDRARKRVRDSFIAKVRQFEDLELLFSEGVAKHFMETSQCIVIKKGVRLGLPTGVTAVEQSQAKGREEQRLRALRDFLQIMTRCRTHP